MQISISIELCIKWPGCVYAGKVFVNGDLAIALFNMGDIPASVAVDFWDIGLTVHANKMLEFYDCIEHKQLGAKEEIFSEVVAAHGSKVYRCRLVS